MAGFLYYYVQPKPRGLDNKATGLGTVLTNLKMFYTQQAELSGLWEVSRAQESQLVHVVIPNVQKTFPSLTAFWAEICDVERLYSRVIEGLMAPAGEKGALLRSITTLLHETLVRPANVFGQGRRALCIEDLRVEGTKPNRLLMVAVTLSKPSKDHHDARKGTAVVAERTDAWDPVDALTSYLSVTGRSFDSKGPVFRQPGKTQNYSQRCYLEDLRGRLTPLVGERRAKWYCTRSFRSGGLIDFKLQGGNKEAANRRGMWSEGTSEELYSLRTSSAKQAAAEFEATRREKSPRQ